jgi:predicted nucleic-acid-binding Zn-ribbon protein
MSTTFPAPPHHAPPPHAATKAAKAQRRATMQREVRCDLSVIPVRLDRTPGEVCWSTGCTIDVEASNLTITIDRANPLPGRSIVIGASPYELATAFVTLNIVSQQHHGGSLQLNVCPVAEPADDLLSPQQLTPRVDAKQFCFRYGCPADVLERWESLGVIRKYLVDRILVCPHCSSIPTWRYACPKCGSARYGRTSLVHHFACAHVGPADSFQATDGGLRCPKCRATRLIAGTDFQYVAGPLSCFDCEQTGCQPTLSCLCHRCAQRFDPSAATEQELYGYHVERLDLLDLVAASQ